MSNDLRIIQPNCDKCTLPGTRIVWGKGTPGGLVIVGEAPGQNEAVQGEPFVGAAGKLLRIALERCGWSNTPTYFTNTVMCRPPENRDPSELEVGCCHERLVSEILFCKPTHILVLGSVASKAMLGKPITKYRGQLQLWNGIPLIASYHPAYCLRNPDAFRDLEFDLEKLHKEYVDYTEESRRHSKAFTEAEALEYVYRASGIVSIDIETAPLPQYKKVDKAALNPAMNYLTRIGIRSTEIGSVCIRQEAITQRLADEILRRAKDKWQVLCFNAQFEQRNFLYHYGGLLTVYDDPMLQHHSIDERSGGGVSRRLKTLGRLYRDLDDWSETLKTSSSVEWQGLDDDTLDEYLAVDLWATEEVHYDLIKQQEEEKQLEVHHSITIPTCHILSKMTHTGILADRAQLTKLDFELGAAIERLEDEIRHVTGPEFNPGSPKQVSTMLFDVMGLPRLQGNSTGAAVLSALAQDTEAADLPTLILKFRELAKRHGTYVNGLAQAIGLDGRIHGKFNQHRTTTYRLSSDDPNLQNIPRPGWIMNVDGSYMLDVDGKRIPNMGTLIRNVFIAPEGYEFLALDYSQIEVFVMALTAKDDNLISLLQDQDVYRYMCSKFYKVDYDKVTKDQRQRMKPIVLGGMYDRRAKAIAEVEKMEVAFVQQQLDTFFEEFKGVRRFLDTQPGLAMEQGYVESLYGRRRRFPLITSDYKLEAARQSINAPIQGAACDIVCSALIRLDREPLVPILQIHDDLTFYVPTDRFEEGLHMAVEEMTKDPFPTPLKFRVEAKRGVRWGELEEVKL